MSIYVTYLTTYYGKKLPQFYIGSSTEKKVNSGYRGSVESKKYKKIWKEELKNNPNLFKTVIITRHKTREEATKKELYFQTKLNVVKSPMYINLSLARPNGFFGRDVSGENNPMFNPSLEMRKRLGESKKGRIVSEKHKKAIIESNKKRRKHPIKPPANRINGKLVQSEETKKKNSESSCKFLYKIICPDGVEIYTKNVKQFCRENNLNSGTMYAVINGYRKHHKKYKGIKISTI